MVIRLELLQLLQEKDLLIFERKIQNRQSKIQIQNVFTFSGDCRSPECWKIYTF